jgi:tRNA threonylcarbamoyladenosine modification (KEOPS) complex Cgi121 subunit
MLKYIEEYWKYVEITGFRDVTIGDAKSFLCCLDLVSPRDFEVQLFDADLVASWQHLYFAMLNSLLAFRGKLNLSKSLSVETLLYASSQRQIKKALDLMGVKPTSKNIAVIVVSEKTEPLKAAVAALAKTLGVNADETVLDLSSEKIMRIRGAFEISEVEFGTVAAKGCSPVQGFVDLVIERVALLSTRL